MKKNNWQLGDDTIQPSAETIDMIMGILERAGNPERPNIKSKPVLKSRKVVQVLPPPALQEVGSGDETAEVIATEDAAVSDVLTDTVATNDVAIPEVVTEPEVVGSASPQRVCYLIFSFINS